MLLLRKARPSKSDILPLGIVALGVVIGFPLLSALALQQISAARSIIFIGLLPLATALFGVLRGKERPHPVFWGFTCLRSVTIGLYAASHSGQGTLSADLLMLGAILICGLGHAEGAVLSKRIGGWQVISWALVLASPLMVALLAMTWPTDWSRASVPIWTGLGYVSVFSILIGFVFCYRDLALGGSTKVEQLQLLQPFFGLLMAGAFMGEPVAWSVIALTAVVVDCVAGAKRFA